MQTVPLSAVAVQVSGSAHEVQGIYTTKPERLGLLFLMSWNLQLLLQPELGRWDPG